MLISVLAVKAWAQTPNWFFAAEGVRYPEEVAAYRKTGMTVLWVRLPFRVDGDFSDYDALLDEADKQGLPYILALDLRPPPMLRTSFRCAPHDAAYLAWLRRWLDVVIPHFRQRPHLLGYALGREVDEAVSYDDEGFALFLQSRYPSLELLAKTWQLPVSSWFISQVTAMQADDQQSPLQYGRPSLDVALYQWTTLQTLLALWAQEVRQRDPNPQHLLLAGPLTTYRSLSVVPPNYQGIIPFLSPERAESDWMTHNCHAVAIARRGGRFLVLPMLTTRLRDGRVVLPEALSRWTMAAIAMGAGGVVFNDWSTIHEVNEVRDHVIALVQRVKSELPSPLSPKTRTAILYTPFGEGTLDGQGRPLYGFAVLPKSPASPVRLSWDEPASLFFALRFHPWGTVDVLTPMELTAEWLSRYRVLFAPVAAYLEPSMQANLATFVVNGGIVVADLGLGAFHAEVPFQTLPPILKDLFGLTVLRRLVIGPSVRTNLVVVRPHPLFPNLPEGFEIGNAVGAFGPVLGLMPAARAHYWGLFTVARTGKRIVKQEGKTVVLPGVPERAAVLINSYGRGYAVFASAFLWTMWSPQDIGFDRFHGALISQGATLQLVNSSFVPSVWVSETDKGILLINPTKEPQSILLHWRMPLCYALLGTTVRPISFSPLIQAVQLRLRPHDWVFLLPVADLSPPAEVAADIVANQLRLRVGPTPTGKVTVRFWHLPLSSPSNRWRVRVGQGGEEQEVVPDQWGRVVVLDVPTPTTITLMPAKD